MNKKVIKNLIAAVFAVMMFSLGFYFEDPRAPIVALIADILLILYVIYLINFQRKLDTKKYQKSKLV